MDCQDVAARNETKLGGEVECNYLGGGGIEGG